MVEQEQESPAVQEDAKPLSRLKQQRKDAKDKKVKRKVKRFLKTEHGRQIAAKKKKVNEISDLDIEIDKPAVWEEGKELSLNVYNLINTYMTIAQVAHVTLTQHREKMTDEVYDDIILKTNVLAKDVEVFLTKWGEVCAPMQGKTGSVDQNDLPRYYVVYEELLEMNIDIINVLTEPGEEISLLISDLGAELPKIEAPAETTADAKEES